MPRNSVGLAFAYFQHWLRKEDLYSQQSPFIFSRYQDLITYLKNVNKDKGFPKAYQKAMYKEQFLLAINPKLLIDGHLFVEFEKEKEADVVMKEIKSVQSEFGVT